jgi:TPR repeat protein
VSMNICKTFGVCLAIFLLPLSGCSENKNSTPGKSGPFPLAPNEFERTLEGANAGDAMAQYNLGVVYDDGHGVPEDDVEAVKWYRLAAEQGVADAQYNLGLMYYNGTGVPQDYAEAVKWFRLAAEQGIANAQYTLGAMYANREGVPQDYAEAVKWFRLAAEQGLAVGQQFLGLAYALGEGVPEDDVEAYAWLSVAALGDVSFEKNRDFAKESLSGSQLALGQRRATELFEKYGSGK